MLKNIISSVATAIVVSIVVTVLTLSSQGGKESFGSFIETVMITFGAGFQAGPDGTKVKELQATTCNLSTTVANLALATTTKPFYCQVTGVQAGDHVFVELASDGGSLAAGTFPIIKTYAKASTTDGFIEVGLAHPTDGVGAAATSSFPLATTSARVFRVDPL